MLVSAAVLAGVVVPFPSFAEYFGPVSRIPAVDGHWILSQIIEPRSCINNDISYTFALSRGRSVRPRLQPHLLSYCQVGFCRRGPSCLPLFNAFVPCHWLSNGNQVDLKCDCNFFPLVGWVGWYLFLVKAPSAAVMPPQRPDVFQRR